MTEEMKAMIELVNKALAGVDEDKIKEVLDFLGYKEDGKFIPKENERYWLIDAGGWVSNFSWNDGRVDNYQLSLGNVYRTKEEAEQALDFQTRKAGLIKEIEDSSEPIDWCDENKEKYYIWLNYPNDILRVGRNAYYRAQGATYTTNERFLEELIKTRPDEIKELLFDIKS